MSTDLTAEEKAAIRRLKKALAGMPDSLRIYVVDTSVTVCKDGVPSADFAEHVGDVTTSCAVLTDVHP